MIVNRKFKNISHTKLSLYWTYPFLYLRNKQRGIEICLDDPEGWYREKWVGLMGRHNSACVVTAQGDFIKQPPHWWRRMGTGTYKSIYKSLWVTHCCSVDFCLFLGLHECFYGNLHNAMSWGIGPDFRPHPHFIESNPCDKDNSLREG